MRLLLDTHVLIWAMDEPTKLSGPATIALQDPANDLLLSAATVWELAIKIGSGKLAFSLPYRQRMDKASPICSLPSCRLRSNTQSGSSLWQIIIKIRLIGSSSPKHWWKESRSCVPIPSLMPMG